MKYRQVINILPRTVQTALKSTNVRMDYLQEIRLRVNHAVILLSRDEEIILPVIISENDIQETLNYVSDYSLFAYEHEMKQGFITIEGGHRVGMAGQVFVENGRVKNLKQVTFLNIRISHEILGCADKLFPYISHKGSLYHTLLVSPPKCGKTTMLRDAIRQISDGNSWIKGCSVGVVDERSELGGCYRGIPQNQIGMRTDVLDGCPKSEGMLMLIRSMSPQVIAADEIGAPEEIQTIRYAMHCGCKMLVTVHGLSFDEIRRKPLFRELVEEECMERYVVLKNGKHVGEIAEVYDQQGSVVCLNG